jgi:uncharacterized protein YqfA (UPF0365 family)
MLNSMSELPILADGTGGIFLVILLVVLAVLALVIVIFVGKYLGLWIQAFASKAKIGIFDLIGMGFRKVNPRVIVRAKVAAVKAGLQIETRDLESHYLAGGNVPNVVRGLIAANRADIDLDFRRASGIDLAGRDILDAVQTSVRPKVIDCPDPSKGSQFLDGVAKDGIRLLVKARVTVRMNIERLVGGATQETIIARVGQGIVSAIGSSASYKDVLENPDTISQAVLASGLDSQTAFEIVSIDIADITIPGLPEVANVGAMLEAERAEADKKLRQAEAEGRRAMAVAREQEMEALVRENRAKVVEAEAEVPRAIASAFREGNLGIMDYYRLRNVQADTDMRSSIAGEGPTEGQA